MNDSGFWNENNLAIQLAGGQSATAFNIFMNSIPRDFRACRELNLPTATGALTKRCIITTTVIAGNNGEGGPIKILLGLKAWLRNHPSKTFFKIGSVSGWGGKPVSYTGAFS